VAVTFVPGRGHICPGRQTRTNPRPGRPRMRGMNRLNAGQRKPDSDPAQDERPDLTRLLTQVARGDHNAFEVIYAELAGPVYGVVRQVLRDPAQSEEVAQEALLEVWRTASRFDPAKGSAAAWTPANIDKNRFSKMYG